MITKHGRRFYVDWRRSVELALRNGGGFVALPGFPVLYDFG